jgi:hypothetical protein
MMLFAASQAIGIVVGGIRRAPAPVVKLRAV